MKRLVTTAIVLARTDFKEADRILTVITPEQGKLRILAKAVRKVKSKLAGGIELLSVNQLTLIVGRGEILTLISSRLEHPFSNIVRDIDRTMLSYEILKRINKVTEDNADSEYYQLTERALSALDNMALSLPTIELWFGMQLLKISGHAPNLRTDVDDKHLSADSRYEFSVGDMAFVVKPSGHYRPNDIKVLRLAHRAATPDIISNVTGADEVAPRLLPLVKTILKHQLHI
jgi:DNA repair protein RecO (recombination protein O)